MRHNGRRGQPWILLLALLSFDDRALAIPTRGTLRLQPIFVEDPQSTNTPNDRQRATALIADQAVLADNVFRQLGIDVQLEAPLRSANFANISGSGTWNADPQSPNDMVRPLLVQDAGPYQQAGVIPVYLLPRIQNGRGQTHPPHLGYPPGIVLPYGNTGLLPSLPAPHSDTLAHELGHFLLNDSLFLNGAVHFGGANDLLGTIAPLVDPNVATVQPAGPQSTIKFDAVSVGGGNADILDAVWAMQSNARQLGYLTNSMEGVIREVVAATTIEWIDPNTPSSQSRFYSYQRGTGAASNWTEPIVGALAAFTIPPQSPPPADIGFTLRASARRRTPMSAQAPETLEIRLVMDFDVPYGYQSTDPNATLTVVVRFDPFVTSDGIGIEGPTMSASSAIAWSNDSGSGALATAEMATAAFARAYPITDLHTIGTLIRFKNSDLQQAQRLEWTLTVGASYSDTAAFRRVDFDGNGSVTTLDLNQWESGFASLGATRGQGDGDGDGDVDGNDFLLWQRHVGIGVSTVETAAHVPEPLAATLMFVMALALRGRRCASTTGQSYAP